jgi:hypothetical protein
MLHGTCNRILISNNETENKKYRSVGTVQKSNRKTKNTAVSEQFKNLIEKQKIPVSEQLQNIIEKQKIPVSEQFQNQIKRE